MPDCNRQFPVRVDVRLTEAERDYLTEEAVKRGMSRQDMLRRLLLAEMDSVAPVREYKPVVLSNGREAIDRAITAVTRQYNCIPRHQLEPVVCTVIAAVAEPTE